MVKTSNIEGAVPPSGRRSGHTYGRSPSAELPSWQDRMYYRAFTIPAVLVIALTVVMPLGLLVAYSLIDEKDGGLTLGHYVSSLTSEFFIGTLLTTLLMAIGVTTLCIVLAMPVAYVLARRTVLRNVLIPILSVPRMLPFVVVGYSMVLLLAPYTGVINKLLMDAGIWSEPSFMLFGWPGQALAFTYSGLVVAIGILTAVFMSIDPQLEDAAVCLGAGRFRAIATVTMPLGVPGLIAASALIFSTIVTAYSIPVMLNSRAPYMVSVIIYNNLYSLQQKHLAYAQAVIVSVLAIGVTASAQLLLSQFGSRR